MKRGLVAGATGYLEKFVASELKARGHFVRALVRSKEKLGHLQDTLDELRRSGVDHTVPRPTGYFSDLGDVFEMARSGRVWLIGAGENLVNPTLGADLAVACADSIESGTRSLEAHFRALEATK